MQTKLMSLLVDALIQDLVVVSSIERGSIELQPVSTDVGELISEVIEALSLNLVEQRQVVEYTAAEDGLEAVVDRQRIVQVVSNLLGNASKYSPSDTTIFVKAEELGEQVVVTVEDEGPGIPVDDIGQVFDLFHRVDNETTRQVAGTGQGLYLVRQLVELHGGSARIGNRYLAGNGTRVVVILPKVFGG